MYTYLIPIIHTVYVYSDQTYFAGEAISYTGMELTDFLNEWWRIKDRITVPFIVLCQGNENWGCLSTVFPNRTRNWGMYSVYMHSVYIVYICIVYTCIVYICIVYIYYIIVVVYYSVFIVYMHYILY